MHLCRRESILLKQRLAVDSLVLNRRKARARERIESFQRELTGRFAVASRLGRRGRFDWNTTGTHKEMGVAPVQIPVLSLELEQAGLKLADRAAFDDRGNFGDQLRRLWLPMSY